MSLLCLFYVSFMSLLCLFYVSYMSLICLFYLSLMSVSGLSPVYLIQTCTHPHTHLFRVYLQDKLGCNYFAANTYLDEDDGEQKSMSVGLIKQMYLFKLHSTAPEEIFIEGDWYVPVGKSRLGLTKMEYSANFETERMGFLKHCRPYNVALWPCNPFKRVRLNTNKVVTRIDVSVSRAPDRQYILMTHRTPYLEA